MAYHPLLDWRTGLDMARLALDPSAQIDLRYPYWQTLLSRITGPYFAGLGLTAGRLAGLMPAVIQPIDAPSFSSIRCGIRLGPTSGRMSRKRSPKGNTVICGWNSGRCSGP